MHTFTFQCVDVDDVLTQDQIEVFNQDDLPWTFGDTALNCITQAELIDWMERNEMDISNFPKLPEHLLIMLHENCPYDICVHAQK